MATIDEAFETALTLHQAGRWQAAEDLYRRILEAAPQHPDGWHLLGVIACQTGRLAEAIECFEHAIALAPKSAVFHNSLGNAVRIQGRRDAALACYRRAVECQPDLAEAHKNLGQTLGAEGRFREAAESFQRALQLRPGDPEVQQSLLNAALNEIVWTQRPPELPSARDDGREPLAAVSPAGPEVGKPWPYDLVILVPYRDRLEHLRRFAPHMQRFLQDKLSFKLVVVEQVPGAPFNRGKLLNAGFAMQRDEAGTFALHDVDTLPQDEACEYRLADQPMHLAGRASKYGDRLPYPNFLGAVFVLRREQFAAANGFSNEYWGWGREDDEFARRLWAAGITWGNRPGRYESLEHPLADLHSGNDARLLEFLRGERDWRTDGLNSLQFEVLRRVPLSEFLLQPDLAPHHSLVTVDIGRPG